MICLCPRYGAKASFDSQSMMVGSPPEAALHDDCGERPRWGGAHAYSLDNALKMYARIRTLDQVAAMLRE
jgi:hypothetical protein